MSGIARVVRGLELGGISGEKGVRVSSIPGPACQAGAAIDARPGVTLITSEPAVAVKSVEGVSFSLSIGLAGCPRDVKQNTNEGNLKIRTSECCYQDHLATAKLLLKINPEPIFVFEPDTKALKIES